MEWFRWYHGACSDAKWPIIARKAKVSVGVVVSVWAALLEYASQDEERGSVAGFDGETYDALYGYEDGTCDAVLAAMIDKGLICDGCICAWSKRQVEREREERGKLSTERVRRFRERQRAASPETLCNADETPSETLCNTDETPETPKNRTEQRKEEKNTPPTQEYVNNPNTRARVAPSGEEGGGAEPAASAVPGEAGELAAFAVPAASVWTGEAGELAAFAVPAASVWTGGAGEPAGADAPPSVSSGPSGPSHPGPSRPGPARTDAPSKGTPEWTAFLSCWDVYPVKQGQEEAWREWMRLKRNGTLEAAFVIREAILRLSAGDSRWRRGKVPKFARWLNGKGWQDEPYVEPGEADAVRALRGGRDGTALPGGGRNGEPAAPTEYQRQRQSSRRMAAALLAGRLAADEGNTQARTGGAYEATAFATAGGALPALRAGSLA